MTAGEKLEKSFAWVLKNMGKGTPEEVAGSLMSEVEDWARDLGIEGILIKAKVKE